MLVRIAGKGKIMAIQTPYCLTETDLNHLKKWFSHYVRSFYCADPVTQQAIVLKEEHSLRVCSEILNVGRQLGMSQNGLRIAEAMALFHDIGRFDQFTRYRTFVDRKSENHAQLGVEVLRRENTLAALNEETRNVIIKAISFHNRLSIPDGETQICMHFSRLLRDADKLDIFNLVSTYYCAGPGEKSNAIELDLPDTPGMSDEILTSLLNGKMISMQQMRSLNDFKLLQMAWIYDINFQPAFQIIQERDYLKKIRDALPESDRIDQIYDHLLSYLKQRSDCSDSPQIIPV
ncbi:MAG: HD family phosphohydrolase [Deltaproteobacteria bacterium HGW-Deltaproteobacteria-1]|jgi:putative nucleotidyltransferase with HDIG domain|nr:MAG: HD family phosphohydrolase [Deltaproteobacteria bacterium HGW-Deltaproteobacteria-1]